MKKNLNTKKLAIVGGGQLGMMLTQAAKPLGVEVVVLDSKGVSAHQVGAVLVEGAIKNPDDIARLSQKFGKDAPITIEIEHVAIDALKKLQKDGFTIHPDPESLSIISDKYEQKKFLKKHKIPVADFKEIKSNKDVLSLLEKWKNGLVLKSRKGGFDGRGNVVIKNKSDVASENIKKMIKAGNVYAEKICNFEKEVAAILVKDVSGGVMAYPLVETVHEDNICNIVISPARISNEVKKQAEKIGLEVVKNLNGAGVFAIEMFVTKNGKVLVNEIAPRVHNSGHLTIEAHKTSQFSNHVRAVMGEELGSTEMVVPHAVMINILRGKGKHAPIVEKVGKSGYIHWYGKEGRMFPDAPRKIGHVTGLGNTFEEAMATAQKIHDISMKGIL